MDKTTMWLVIAVVGYFLLKDHLFGTGQASGSFAVGGSTSRIPPYAGPSPSGHTYASVPPPSTNVYDVLKQVASSGGTALDDYLTGDN
jgi:hypothetical protein